MLDSFLHRFKGDRYLWLFTTVLTLFSLMVVYSSTESLAFREKASLEYYLIKHAAFAAMGISIMFLFHFLNYRVYRKVATLVFFLAIPLLIYTLVAGTSINDANRWITIPGIGLSFQSSDLAKIALILFLARLLSDKTVDFSSWSLFRKCMVPISVIFILIVPTNLSTAAMLFGTGMVIMFMGRFSTSKLILAGMIMLALIGLTISTGLLGRAETWKARLERFTSDDHEGGEENIQTKHSKIAVASGGFFGEGPGNGKQKNYLPHAYSDFVYAIIIEEYGLIGGAVVFLLYLLIFQRGLAIARKAQSPFGALIAVGITFQFLLQAIINMAVSLDLFPVTGQTLPLLSLGGSSQIITFSALGIVQSVARDSEEAEAMKQPENVVLT
jgi:cell division protein FtsW